MDKRRGKLIRDLMALNISEGEAIQYAEIGAYQLHDIVEEEENKKKDEKGGYIWHSAGLSSSGVSPRKGIWAAGRTDRSRI